MNEEAGFWDRCEIVEEANTFAKTVLVVLVGVEELGGVVATAAIGGDSPIAGFSGISVKESNKPYHQKIENLPKWPQTEK